MFHIKRAYEAYIDGFQEITMIIPKSNKHTVHSYFELIYEDNRKTKLPIVTRIEFERFIKYTVFTPEDLLLENKYEIEDEFGVRTDLQVGGVIRSNDFDEKYAYDGEDLGASYSNHSTQFKLWAPTASKVKLRIYQSHGDEEKFTEKLMERDGKGTWKVIIDQNCDGLVYNYLVCVNLIWREAVDPYAKAVTLNGKNGVVIDLSKGSHVSKVNSPPQSKYTDCIIYEASIRDFTSHPLSGVHKKGSFEGFHEKGTTYNELSTGLDYLCQLGVTHIELLPFFDFEGIEENNPFQSYNWGYNPLNFNAPEGSYSLKPEEPMTRITELKRLISVYHEHGLRIIMDVVYNHVYELQTSNFEKIVPGYYFRQDERGLPSNGTGVGNDFASERLMARRFILQSLKYWTEEYDIDGFRFDLMGILDTDTMNQIVTELTILKPEMIIFGEGWDLNTSLSPSSRKATINQSHQLSKIGFFNDKFRDGIKGSTFSVQEIGFIQGKLNHDYLSDLLLGSVGINNQVSLFQEPYQSINYVESHDNHTMWDRLKLSNGKDSEELLKKRHILGTSIALFSFGVPFIHSGQEFFRTKEGIENSYNSGDTVNSIDWARAERESSYINIVKEFIAIRKRFNCLRFSLKEEIVKHIKSVNVHQNIIGYRISGLEELDGVKEIMVLFHNGLKDTTIDLGNKDNWEYVWDGNKHYVEKGIKAECNKLPIPLLSTVVLVKY
ncbi:type I pullulanase [Bacillus sp. AFS017336]|uniref:type I pullulanase n=1 Tax=Bacillus sp. AFS017336 TaxID=2033489 RepID=UPI000BEFCC15|nr:type I pullulanase [Bacillus sp. AFS017336]PEL12430.1 type I pullulanase [Bacillus sp. AFS017336]